MQVTDRRSSQLSPVYSDLPCSLVEQHHHINAMQNVSADCPSRNLPAYYQHDEFAGLADVHDDKSFDIESQRLQPDNSTANWRFEYFVQYFSCSLRFLSFSTFFGICLFFCYSILHFFICRPNCF